MKIYCTNCCEKTAQNIEFANSEFIATCSCGRQLKFPKTNSVAELQSLVDAHYEQNKNQIPAGSDADPSVIPPNVQSILDQLNG